MTRLANLRLDAEQRSAATAPGDRPLVIVAGAGTGKTTTLVGRIAHMLDEAWVTPEQVLAVTHTTKAAGELRERLARTGAAGVACSTVHSAAWKIVREYPNAAGFDAVPDLLANTYPMVRNALEHVTGVRPQAAEVADMASEIEWARAWGISPGSYAESVRVRRRDSGLDARRVREVWEVFERQKLASRSADFSDILHAATIALRDPTVGATVRDKWRAVVVDEFQDTDRAQFEFISAVRNGRPLYSVVGDGRQTIYSFKGADSTLLAEALESPAATVVHLTTSYRCSNQIVKWANSAIGEQYGPPLKGIADGLVPSVVATADDESEVDEVIKALTGWRKQGVGYTDMAVLFRFNSAAARFESALSIAKIPYHVTGSQPFFERPEVLAVLTPFGKEARGRPDADGAMLLAACAEQTGWAETRPPAGQGAARGRWESVLALVDLSRSMEGLTAGELLSKLLSAARGGGSAGVTVGTIHAAKGLEWDAVCIAGCVEGQLPSVYANDAASIEEERRLFYVAITRAKRHLLFTYPLKRARGGASKPSRFLNLLPTRRAVKTSARHTTGSADSLTSSNPIAGLACGACGGRLTSLAARKAIRCSPGCLEGAAAARWANAVAWRSESGANVGDRALFHLVVVEEPGPLWPAAVALPDLG